jgi:hypothetical protein
MAARTAQLAAQMVTVDDACWSNARRRRAFHRERVPNGRTQFNLALWLRPPVEANWCSPIAH